MRIVLFDFKRKIERLGFFSTQHRDNQINTHFLQYPEGFLFGGCLNKLRRIPQIEADILIVDLFIDPAVFFQNKGIIFARNQQNMINAFFHEITEGGLTEKKVFGEQVAGIHRRGIVLLKDRK